MKAKYLVDQCSSNRRCFKKPVFVHSVDLIGEGASDQEVLKLSKRLGTIIITCDKRFALDILLGGDPVICDYENQTSMIVPKIINDPIFSDPITHYLLSSQTVVIP